MQLTPDIINKIVDTPATFDDEGNQLTQPTHVPGFHVNFPQEVPEIADYKVDPQPATPVRIYAGGIKPVAYRFPDEDTFRTYFPEPSNETDQHNHHPLRRHPDRHGHRRIRDQPVAS